MFMGLGRGVPAKSLRGLCDVRRVVGGAKLLIPALSRRGVRPVNE